MKVKRTVVNSPSPNLVTDYVNGIQYEGGVAEQMMQPAGFLLRQPTGAYEYRYTLSDHLGNTRAVVNASGQVQQTNTYYPFGENITALNYVPAGCTHGRIKGVSTFLERAENAANGGKGGHSINSWSKFLGAGIMDYLKKSPGNFVKLSIGGKNYELFYNKKSKSFYLYKSD